MADRALAWRVTLASAAFEPFDAIVVHAHFLHDNLANLLLRRDGAYETLADWFTYQAYASQQGNVATTAPGAQVDVFATLRADQAEARLLVGNHGAFLGRARIDVNGLDRTDLARAGSVRAIISHIAYNDGLPSDGPTQVSDASVLVFRSGQMTLSLDFTSPKDAFVVRLLAPDSASAIGVN